MDLREQGFRYIRRNGEFKWTHPAEVIGTDLDCTDMTDDEFMAAVLEAA